MSQLLLTLPEEFTPEEIKMLDTVTIHRQFVQQKMHEYRQRCKTALTFIESGEGKYHWSLYRENFLKAQSLRMILEKFRADIGTILNDTLEANILQQLKDETGKDRHLEKLQKTAAFVAVDYYKTGGRNVGKK